MGDESVGPAARRAWWREPLVHFLLGGLAIFLVSAWRGEDVDPAARTIVITADAVNRMAAGFAGTWQRPPRPDEIDALIRDTIKEEIYVREALRLGLDDGDPVIRRRLRAKMQHLADADRAAVMPAPGELERWYARHAARYAPDPRLSFDQVYLGPATDADIPGTARALLADFSRGGAWQGRGAAISLPPAMDAAPRADVARQFGTGFATALSAAPRGQWSGPVASGFGWHLVRLRAIDASSPPDLTSVRDRATDDWRAATAAAREAAAYQSLLDAYDIRIARP